MRCQGKELTLFAGDHAVGARVEHHQVAPAVDLAANVPRAHALPPPLVARERLEVELTRPACVGFIFLRLAHLSDYCQQSAAFSYWTHIGMNG